jgi:alpha-glucosidase (family GH31 glycosyl hydrolase)
MRKYSVSIILLVISSFVLQAQPLHVNGMPVRLDIRIAEANSLRITLRPQTYHNDFPYSPALSTKKYGKPVISISETKALKKAVGRYTIEITHQPLTVHVFKAKGSLLQEIRFEDNGDVSFPVKNESLLGLGEGGSRPAPGTNWRQLAVEFDRKGRMDSMQPRWQGDAYGSRNPVPMMIGTSGWAMFVVSPWVYADLRNKDRGIFSPWKPPATGSIAQNEKNQQLDLTKGRPPVDQIIPGLFDLFLFDASDPLVMMKEFATITGPAVMPPKWALGYMQSHRTLEDDSQMLGLIDTFRAKKIPLDAVIYLGTGFTPRGWNTMQPSFTFNPEVFKRDPADVIKDMHNRNVKVVLHMVPWDRDRLPGLHGNIPPGKEKMDAAHISNYWRAHLPLLNNGVDAFWPDEGDWFDLHERIKRHQLYYQGHLSYNRNVRPWSLHRNGYPGIAQWGGWVWSGDTEASWKTLEAQIAVGLNYSLSIGPYWGTDIGGFYPNAELTGELYARWFQFGAFNALFRSHGKTWHTRLPWGWGRDNMGPREHRENPLQSEMNNPAIEPVIKQYAELRYRLLSYTYGLAYEAWNKGLPLMRALWLHYPHDSIAVRTADQYLWGANLMIAPVYQKGSLSRNVYLPPGEWYDWWTNEKQIGGRNIAREVDLSIMPIYVRAGTILPLDPVRQYTGEKKDEPLVIRIYPGENAGYTLYEDDGSSLKYQSGDYKVTRFSWDDQTKTLTITPRKISSELAVKPKKLLIELVPGREVKTVNYQNRYTPISF